MNISRSNVSRSARHVKSVAAVLAAALLATSSWLVLRADVPQVASGTWAPAGDVGAIPSGAASVALPDGRVLVAGGTIAGALSNGIATYDPAAGAWASGGNLVVARSGHSAALLKDGRVLFAGGTASEGPSFDIEIYDPATGVSAHAGDMTLARVDHAAATLRDGRVLIVGGFDGQSSLNLAETFDPATGQSAGVAAVMSTGRVKATATTLLDGHVLVAGGNDGTQDLASAEIFDAASGAFFATGAMQTARSGHVAVLLPSNNQVLIAGGMAAGAAVASAELYADWNDGFSTTPNPMSTARAGGIAGGLLTHDLALVAGGGTTSGEFYGYATVKTDRADYWPGEKVTVTGAGWQPGETVTIVISEDADTHYDFTYSAVADASGAITNAEFAPIENEVFHHFGKKFYVAARGAASSALNTFTDGNVTLHLATPENVASMTVFFQRYDASSTCSGTADLTSSILVSAGGGANIPGFGGSGKSVLLTSVTTTTPGKTFDNWTSGDNKTDSGTAIPGSPTPCIANGTGTNGNVSDGYAHFRNSTASTTLAIAPATGTYGGATSLTATLSSAGSGVNGKVISFTLNGTSVGTATTNASGVATLSGVSLVGINAATYPVGLNSGVTASFAGDASFGASSGSNTLTVAKGALTVTANSASRAFGVANPTFTSTITGFVNSETASVLTSQPTCTTTATATSAASPPTYPITCSGGAATNYAFNYVDGALTIDRVVLTVTAENKTKVYGAALPALTVTYSGFVGSDSAASLGGTLSVTTTATASSPVGTYPITASGYTSSNYTIIYVPGTLTVSKAPLTITAAPSTKVYGEVNPAFTVTYATFVNGDTAASLGGTLAFTTAATTASAVGAYDVTPGGLTSDNYAITFVKGTLTINKAPLTVTAQPSAKTYGAPNPAFTATYATFVIGETEAVLGGTLVFTTTATDASPVGSYDVTPGGLTSANYDITFVKGTLTINKAPLTVTAQPSAKTYGAPNPTFTATYATFVNGETEAVLAGTLVFTTTATDASPVGSYDVTPGGLTSANYDITFVKGTLTVTKAPLTVTVAPSTKVYGAANPAFTVTYAPFVNGDTAASLGGTLAFTTTATDASPVGSYDVTPSGLTSANYDITFVKGTLTVTKAPLTVTAAPSTKVYGAANPAFTVTYATFVNGDTAASLAGTLAFTTTATTASAVGDYDVAPSGLTSANYAITFVEGTLTVTKAPLTVTAAPSTKVYGAANPAFAVTYATFVNGDTPASLGGTLAFTTTATAASPVGSYDVTPSGLTSANYAITFVKGTLTVTKAPLTVTAQASTKVYGAPNPAFTVTYATFVNGDTPASLGGTLAFATTATAASGVGNYDVTPAGLTSANYDITFVKGTLTINKAPLTITAKPSTKILGGANPGFAVAYATFVNGDTEAVLSGTLVFTTTATLASPVGSYDVTPGGLTSANYAIIFVKGTLTVLYEWDGFLQPINDTAHDLGTMSRFKAGQTIPAKFDLKDANGVIVTQSVNPTFNYALIGASCGITEPDTPDLQYPPSSVPLYTLNGGHYQYNWSTKGVAAGLYRIFAKLNDGTTQSVDICLSK